MSIEPRWMGRPATKPGYGDPEPLKPVSTMDSPENVATCLSCRLARCRMGTVACPLYGQGRLGKGKRLTEAQRLERDGKIRDMVLAGCKNSDICERLHISKYILKRAKRRLRERGTR